MINQTKIRREFNIGDRVLCKGDISAVIVEVVRDSDGDVDEYTVLTDDGQYLRFVAEQMTKSIP